MPCPISPVATHCHALSKNTWAKIMFTSCAWRHWAISFFFPKGKLLFKYSTSTRVVFSIISYLVSNPIYVFYIHRQNQSVLNDLWRWSIKKVSTYDVPNYICDLSRKDFISPSHCGEIWVDDNQLFFFFFFFCGPNHMIFYNASLQVWTLDESPHLS